MKARRPRAATFSLLLAAPVLAGFVAAAPARGPAPVTGGWKGKTHQGLPIHLGVREGPVVTNVRLVLTDAVCGKATIHNPELAMRIDEAGHFEGTLYEANGGVRIEGSVAGPRRIEGRIVVGEDTGLPHC